MLKSILQNNKIENVKVDKITDELFDFRDDASEERDHQSEAFQQLRLSIEKQGLLQPINLTPNKKKDGSYLLIDGRRRFLAVKQLGFKEIPAVIISNKSENELILITLSANIHRKDLTISEKTRAIIKIFAMNGYTDINQILSNAKKLHNKFKTVDEIDVKFIHIFESLGMSANHLYILLQVYRDLSKTAFEKAEKLNLPVNYKQLLTKTILKQHPKIQEGLVEQLKEYDNIDDARIHVNQTIRNLETGAIRKDEDHEGEDVYRWDSKKVEDITDDETEDSDLADIAKPLSMYYLDLRKATTSFLKAVTNHQITRGEYQYTLQHVTKSEYFRKDLIKDMDKSECVTLRYDLVIMQHALKSMIDIIEKKHPDYAS